MRTFTITKSTVQLYKLRTHRGGYWADITIDEYEKAGRISIASDFGHWQHYWGSCGESFKQFLCGLDIHYTAGKFGADRWFDHDATMAGLKKAVADHHFEDERDMMLEELEGLENCEEVNTFVTLAYQADTLHNLWDTGPDIRYDINPSFRRFWTGIWPTFINELKSELQASAENPA